MKTAKVKHEKLYPVNLKQPAYDLLQEAAQKTRLRYYDVMFFALQEYAKKLLPVKDFDDAVDGRR